MNKKCQIFTPENYVRELLDSVGYTQHLYGKRILENSCGDGNILTVIVQRYINDCLAKGFSRTKIKNGLSKDIIMVFILKLLRQKIFPVKMFLGILFFAVDMRSEFSQTARKLFRSTASMPRRDLKYSLIRLKMRSSSQKM